jgi:diaminohydroxyphosphoribosylaminopyrimidine deaminase/5-amino-6-(5-phosphoribosylamino)uracil reductase
MAMREDGSIDKGYITTQDSLNLVHEMRTKIDLMIIGGETVRADRPRLDSRFSKSKKSSNVFIYSNQTSFDETIPLFRIKEREVMISNNLSKIEKDNFIMIEGGYSLLRNIKDEIDCLMLFISHKKRKKNQFNIETLGFRKVYSYMINQFDEIVFLFKLS